MTRTGMLESLDAIYSQELRKGGIKDTKKRRSVAERCEKSWRNCWRRRAEGLWTFAGEPEQMERSLVVASVAIELRPWSRRWLGGRQ